MKTICFIGHRKINITQKIYNDLCIKIENLIIDYGARVFLFGSRSKFDEVCLEIVTDFKSKYPDIQRTYIRAEYAYINQQYKDYLLTIYDDTFFHNSLLNAGKTAYIKRNKIMIDLSDLAIFYCDTATKYNSGTIKAYQYAMSSKKKMINFFND